MNQPPSDAPLYRIGALARLTGIPVTTLRVWETRYGAFLPSKTAGQHRLYGSEDVLRAQLFKQLTTDGHAISTLALLSLAQLQELRNQHRSAFMVSTHQRLQAKTVSMAVVGLGLAGRIESKKFTLNFLSHAIRITDVFTDLAQAASGVFTGKPQILLVRVNVLDEQALQQLQAITQSQQILQVIVVYSYAMASLLATWRSKGWMIRREPMTDEDLADLISSVLIVDAAKSMSDSGVSSMIPPRKYDDAVLARVAGISSSVLCECPQHVADLILQLANFEAYSQACLSRNANDAHLHAFLASVSGSARALFERALEKVAEHEGIKLDPDTSI
jgi:DNA-binding transcriptional MerR regulator